VRKRLWHPESNNSPPPAYGTERLVRTVSTTRARVKIDDTLKPIGRAGAKRPVAR